ncbi:retrovirus-related pol polyprotein from transposon TNT 1-94 [Tanacetum coccineum]|uniref:Retrovirus-related pol polyprotein from transposon TNT 1-94 n=1 Tax=Tanacetum coccineum TaxID=301880 RepID=A0ABQ5HKZ2_9ASTR
MRLIQSLASKELVRNLPKLRFDQHFCDACKIGKQAHVSHKAKNIVSTTRCLELLHMDLFGPSAVRSYGGNRYTLVIVDDYSRYTWTRFLKNKTEAFDQFKIFSKKIQNQLGCTIVSIRTDHGREFDNEVQFGEFCNANEPKNVNEALGDESWIVAMQEELNQFIANDVWELVPQPKNMTIIGTKWVFRNKLDENGVVSQNKARLVAQGYNQQEGIDYDETYAPVARLESIRILLAYACALDFKLFQMDVKSAFLNGFINEEVYVAQPPGFIDFEKPDHVYKLKKALYGLKQAPKAWYDRLKAFLIKHEYKMGMVDNTLFTKKKSSNLIIVQIYVDDIIFGSTCQDMCDEFAKIMHDEFEMSMMGELNFFLGLQIKQMEDGIFFNQSKYIKEMLKKFGLEDSKPMKTPMPDIMFSVCLCARFQEAPKTSHLEVVKRIFRYIKGTTHLGLWYPKGTGIETVVYADSDHAGDYMDRKSTSGISTFVGCCLTSWFSKKQTALAISTTEAEYVSARKACQQALWMKQALIDYDVRLDGVPIMCDNKGAIDLSKNPMQHSRTKHIEIRHHFLRDNVQKGHISIKKVPSIDNIVDILTKPLKRESFNYLRDNADRWRLDELAYGVPSDGPYQTNPPSIEDIILSIRIDREGQVRRIRHNEEIDVLEYQVLTREIEPTLKPLEEIIWENVFCLGGNRDHAPACLCFMLYYAVHSEKFNLAYYMAKRMEWVTKQASKDNEDPSWSNKFQDKENLEDIFHFGSALEDFISVVFVPNRNIVDSTKLPKPHLEAVKRIFRYIKGTTHLGLWYPKGTGIETVVYADFDHAGDYVDRKSTSGICTFVGCCLTSWFSKKQTALAISTTEAEYVSAGKACQQALWMKQALIDYDVRLDDVPIMCDNKGAIDLSKNPVQHSRTKHIEIRHHFLRDNVQKGHISIEKVPSVDNIADILTKPLKRESFNYLRLGLGMMEHIP